MTAPVERVPTFVLRGMAEQHSNSDVRSLAAEVLELRSLLAASKPALEAGADLLLAEANVERRHSGRYDIGGVSFAKHDSRARTAARESDQLRSLAHLSGEAS